MALNNPKLVDRLLDRFWQREPEDLLKNPLLKKDVWLLEKDLGVSVPKHRNVANLHFEKIRNEWFKLVLKLYTLLMVNSGKAALTISHDISNLRVFFQFLFEQSVERFEQINTTIFANFQSYLQSKNLRARTVSSYLGSLSVFFDTCRIEGWFDVSTYWFKGKSLKTLPKEIEYIPEEVWNQLDENLYYLPEPLQRMVILMRATGIRVGELCNMPFDCLRKRGDQWRIRFTTEKYQTTDELPIVVPELVAIIQEQQKYIRQLFGDSYNHLFCFCYIPKKRAKLFVQLPDGKTSERMSADPQPKIMKANTFNNWLNKLATSRHICTKEGKQWKFRSHQFRRTVATVMSNAGVRDLIIQKYLRHRSPEMLEHYRYILKQVMKDEYEELLRGKKYVDISGKLVTQHKPKDPITELLRRRMYQITTQYGECHRPIINSSCQTVNACWRCQHWRVSSDDLPYLKDDLKRVEQELAIAKQLGMNRQKQGLEDDRINLLNCLKGLEVIDD